MSESGHASTAASRAAFRDNALDYVRAPGYTIYRGASPDALAPLDVTANPQYADKHVAAGETYYYDVKSRNDAGDESAPSNVINATIPSGAAQ